ncbi:hypothetical protein SAMN05421505_10876 [Sinosporangium album]|uniref:Uncharacterized protein n=1 Tax=Sinosporangium album TaxID=504805 RepID=A0A1G7X7Y3_9ACTN|nr:hypothetical protein [Sinosporangium album]SDG80308.1 hypothetical protein SAMN05421505_10876 [Sinosporangium album]
MTTRKRRSAAPSAGPTRPPTSSKRRRTQTTEFNIQFLADWGLTPGRQKLVAIVVVTLGVLAAAVALTGAVAALGSGFVPTRSSAEVVVGQPRPDRYQGWASPKLFAPIADRNADSAPLTVKEVFPAKVIKHGKQDLRLVSTRLDGDCASAMWGGTVLEQLAEAGCTQAVRGLYLSADRRYIAQYTLLNVKDQQSADAFADAMKVHHRAGWMLALPSTRAVFPTGGQTEGSGHAMGHYVGLLWLARTDGAESTPKDDFVGLSLAVRTVEKPVYRRVVAVTGTDAG